LSVMMIAVINSFLSMLPGMNLWSDAIQGLIILVAVVLNKSLAQREHLQELKEQEAPL
jgi:rhamnose transport system permease protein